MIEVGSAILLLVPRTRLLGAALLLCTMIGAIVTHIRAGQTSQLPVPIILFVLLAIVFWGRRAGSSRLANA